MGFATVAEVVAGTQEIIPLIKATGSSSTTLPLYHSEWYDGGHPPAASVATPGMSGATLTAPVTGAIPFKAAGGSSPASTVARIDLVNRIDAGAIYGWMLADRLWHNSGINMTITTAQAVNSVTWPARDKNQNTSGEGVYIAAEVSSLTGAGTPTLTLDYTNSAGTAGRTGTSIVAIGATAGQGRFYIFSLQAGDTGVQSIQNITLSATWTGGSIALVAFRPIFIVPVVKASASAPNRQRQVEDALSLCAPRIFANSVLMSILQTVNMTGSPKLTGGIQLAQT